MTGEIFTGLFVFLFMLAFYFAPTIQAYVSKKKNAGAIMTLNLLAGWTLIGWIIAMVWATTQD